jgi:chromosome segregation ATPase
MKVWALWVVLYGACTDASQLHRKKDEMTEDAGSNVAAGVDEDSVVELRQQLQESQQEDDTNEAIIESLLGKQQALANTTVALRKELEDVKRKAAKTPPPMDTNEKSQMQKQIAALQLQVGALRESLSNSEKKESEEEGLVSTLRLQNNHIQRRNSQLQNESKWKAKEGRQLRQSLAKTKLALLQSMNTGTATQTQKDSNVDAGGGGAVISSSEVRALSEKLFSASEALNGQVNTLNKKLKKETEKVKEQKAKISELQSQNEKLKSKAQTKSDERGALESSYAEMDSELAQTLHNLRHEEKALRQGALEKAKETDAQVEELQSENSKLKAAGQEVMQKYELLSKAYSKQQREMSFIESKNIATKKSAVKKSAVEAVKKSAVETKKPATKVAALKPKGHSIAHRAPRVFLERSSHYGSPHWRPSAKRAFAALQRHQMMLLQQKPAAPKKH